MTTPTLPARVAELRALMEAIASPDKGDGSFYILQNGRRNLVADWGAVQWRMDSASDARKIIPDLIRAVEALQETVAFIAVMVGRGPDCAIPETITTPLGVPVKIGTIMRDATAALSGRGAAKAAAPERKTVHSLDVDDRGFLQRAARHLAAALEVDDADGAEACVINICEVLSTKPVTIRKMDLGDNPGRGAAKGGGG